MMELKPYQKEFLKQIRQMDCNRVVVLPRDLGKTTSHAVLSRRHELDIGDTSGCMTVYGKPVFMKDNEGNWIKVKRPLRQGEMLRVFYDAEKDMYYLVDRRGAVLSHKPEDK